MGADARMLSDIGVGPTKTPLTWSAPVEGVMAEQESLLARILSERKTIANPVLNRLGLQVARTMTAHGLYHLRSVATPNRYKDQVETLRRDGIVIINDFLPREEFEAVRSEFFDVYSRYQDKLLTLESMNVYEIAYFHKLPPESIPRSRQFIADPTVQALFEGGERRRWQKVFQFAGFERVSCGASRAEPDPQVSLHADAFYHTHKSWLYLDDVTEDNGPLALVKRSHHLTWQQIPYIYSHSCEEGVDASRRIKPEEMERLRVRETVVTCPRNTLVVANTGAYHRRTQGKAGSKRLAVHIMSRTSPFSV